MSSRTRTMGAGNACATSYKTNVNLNTFGGNKKQGVTSRVGIDTWENRAVQIRSNGIGRFQLVCMNQLGGVGAGHSMFGGRYNRADGIHCNKSISGIDFSGYDTIFANENGTSQINYTLNSREISVTNTKNIESITNIIVNTKNGRLVIPVKYNGKNLTITVNEDVFQYITNNLLNNIKFPFNITIQPYQYKKNKSNVSISSSPKFVLLSLFPKVIYVGNSNYGQNFIKCYDTLNIDGTIAYLFYANYNPNGNQYLYYTNQPTAYSPTPVDITCA